MSKHCEFVLAHWNWPSDADKQVGFLYGAGSAGEKSRPVASRKSLSTRETGGRCRYGHVRGCGAVRRRQRRGNVVRCGHTATVTPRSHGTTHIVPTIARSLSRLVDFSLIDWWIDDVRHIDLFARLTFSPTLTVTLSIGSTRYSIVRRNSASSELVWS